MCCEFVVEEAETFFAGNNNAGKNSPYLLSGQQVAGTLMLTG